MKPSIKPNFLIVGAAKSGTTSVYEYLRNHPDVFMPERKEPAFFGPPGIGGVTSEDEYWKLFEKAHGKKAIGEASVAYLYAAESPGRIQKALGRDVKIIVFLRNPIDMAYSLWGHQRRVADEPLSFQEAIAAENTRMADPVFAQQCVGWAKNYAYVNRGRYAEQLRRYYDVFDNSNIRVFIFEEFFAVGLPQFRSLCQFLHISENYQPDGRIHNPAGTVYSKTVRAICDQRMVWKEPFKLILPAGLRKKAMELAAKLNRKDQPLPKIDSETRKFMMTLFEDDVIELESLLGRPLRSLWFSGTS